MQKELKEKELALVKRVISLRHLTGLSRRAFTERYGIAIGTLQHWEGGASLITKSGATRLIKSLQSGGIHCSLDWLLQGIGDPPKLPSSLSQGHSYQARAHYKDDRESLLIAEELKLFQKHYSDAIELVVADDGMQPLYHPGDVLAGIRYHQADIEKTVGLDCIVFSKNAELLVRRVQKSNIHGYYNLVCTNPDTTVEKPILHEIKLVSAAPVIWLRRKAII